MSAFSGTEESQNKDNDQKQNTLLLVTKDQKRYRIHRSVGAMSKMIKGILEEDGDDDDSQDEEVSNLQVLKQ